MTTTTIDRDTATAAVITTWNALNAARRAKSAAEGIKGTPRYEDIALDLDGCMADLEEALAALAATAE